MTLTFFLSASLYLETNVSKRRTQGLRSHRRVVASQFGTVRVRHSLNSEISAQQKLFKIARFSRPHVRVQTLVCAATPVRRGKRQIPVLPNGVVG
jgi:hypothetical protein